MDDHQICPRDSFCPPEGNPNKESAGNLSWSVWPQWFVGLSMGGGGSRGVIWPPLSQCKSTILAQIQIPEAIHCLYSSTADLCYSVKLRSTVLLPVRLG